MLHPLAIQRPDNAPALTSLRDHVIALLQDKGDQASAIAAIENDGHHLSADARRYLLAPPARPKNDWSIHTPAWIFRQGVEERFELVLGTMQGLIGPSEIAGVLKPMSLSAPLTGAGFVLLMWSTAKALDRHGMPEERFWASINNGKPVATDAEVIDPTGRWNDDYRHIARAILNALIRSGNAAPEQCAKGNEKPIIKGRRPKKADEDQGLLDF